MLELDPSSTAREGLNADQTTCFPEDRLVPQELLDTMFTPFAQSPIGGFGYGWI
jgi:hypothetical protein